MLCRSSHPNPCPHLHPLGCSRDAPIACSSKPLYGNTSPDARAPNSGAITILRGQSGTQGYTGSFDAPDVARFRFGPDTPVDALQAFVNRAVGPPVHTFIDYMHSHEITLESDVPLSAAVAVIAYDEDMARALRHVLTHTRIHVIVTGRLTYLQLLKQLV